jgi:photosystem II stability/assembly factor-like uncharacterized protein
MRRMRRLLPILLLLSVPCCVSADSPLWTVQTSGIATNLRGISVANSFDASGAPVVWASGSGGVILRSEDAGAHWTRLHVKDGDALDFRGIRAFNPLVAYVMSIGGGDKSRIYKTADGGETWQLQYSDKRPGFFLDDIVCFSQSQCFAVSDPIDGKFLIISTTDGEHWKELPSDHMPAIIPGEGVFAASGTSLAIYGTKDIYFGTGGGATARVFHSADLGKTWTVTDTPLAAGNTSSGVFSLMRVRNTVIAVGGDYKVVGGNEHAAAYSTDGGVTWKLSSTQPSGFRSGVASIGGTTLLSVGPNGEDISADLGVTWKHTDALNLNAVVTLGSDSAWGAGAKGTIAIAQFISH